MQHRFYPRNLGPREAEALRLIEAHPGVTVRELAGALGVTTGRVHQIVRRLEAIDVCPDCLSPEERADVLIRDVVESVAADLDDSV